ncbi:MAG: type I-B CRISPR-associated protein Cas8b1/Cst1 [Candidatus Omnitrophica bacterium]|nr:type I-B CRISPR-associated protein Cas8b1/Cst1 [Candidatus Omnitrophota bacterium]
MSNLSKITLYPSNWLYNAGVVGFLRVLEFGSKKGRFKEVLEREPFYITKNEIEIVKKEFLSFIEKKFKPFLKKKPKDTRSLLFAKIGGLLPNLQQLTEQGIKSDEDLENWWNKLVENALKEIKKKNRTKSLKCKYCGNEFYRDEFKVPYDFWDKVYNTLMPTPFYENPNWFFYSQNDLIFCGLCKLILILSNFVISQRSELSEFVNVPSIKALYYLNNLLLKLKRSETYKTLNPNERLESLISEALLNYEFLKGAWLLQNVEFIQIEKGGQPKVYTLPVSRTSAELIIRGDVRKSLANLKGQITIVKKEKNPVGVYAQREGIKRFLTGGEGSLVDLAYFSFKNDFMENRSIQARETAFNLSKLEKIKIDYKKERRVEMIESDLIEVWNKGQELWKEKFDRNLQYELLSASLIEDKNRILEYLSEIETRNKLTGKLASLCEFIKSKENLNIREVVLAFIASYKSDKPLSFEDMVGNPLKVFWNEGKEIGKEKDVESKIKKYVFRIISKTRMGDREGTIFEILKLYLLAEKPVPVYLSELFSDKTDMEKFKLIAYSFIAGFIGKDEKGTGDLMYEMERIGVNVIKESLEDRIKKYGYRLLSLIRVGQRSEFAYEIIKLHAQAQLEIPYKFIEILDPDKGVAEFQSLAYGILSGFLEDKKI